MKKIILMFILIFSLSSTVFASVGSKEVTLNYMGITIDIDNIEVVPRDVNGNIVNPFIINGTTYLPVRAIAEALGKNVNWDAETKTVLIEDGSGEYNLSDFKGQSEKIVLQESKNIYYNDISIKINNEAIQPKDVNGFIVEPFIIDGTTYLPVRAVAEAFSKKVDWNNDTKTVFIKSNNEVSKINSVTLKNIDNVLCAEIKSDLPISNYNYYILTDGKIKAEPYLNMRENANASASIISTIPNNEVISIKDIIKTNNEDEWYQVAYLDKTGWVSAKYVETSTARLVIDLNNTNFNIDTASQSIKYGVIDSIRFGDQGNNTSRIVLDINKVTDFNVVQNKEKTITYFALRKNFELPTSILGEDVFVATNDDKLYIPKDEINKEEDVITPPEIEDKTNEEINSGDEFPTDKNDVIINSGDEILEDENKEQDIIIEDEKDDIEKDDEIDKEDKIEEITKNLSSVDSIKYSSSTNKTKIKIDGNYEYSAFTLTNPDRVVIDIKGALLNVDGPTTIKPNNKNITAIRFSQNDVDVVRVVFDINSKADYIITEKDDELSVELEEKTYKNIDYINYGTYATLVLQDTDIDYFDVDTSSSGLKYYITYSSRKFKSGSGTIEVNDDFVEDINIKTTKITIIAQKNMTYKIKQVGDDVVITIKEKSAISDKVILLDAGHGGKDPGTHNGDIYEKVYNLKIALKLYEMLKETDGIEVRISRDSDVYMDREDRFEFILDNKEDADLLVSIHNNALDTSKNPSNKNYKGTMVLYYNKPNEKQDYGITSKELAQIVKDHLVDELGTIDRGIVNRNDQWILTQNNLGEKPEWESTNIPSILCEVIFLSNDEEAARLVTDEFQQKTAQAIYDGIIEAIAVMDNN